MHPVAAHSGYSRPAIVQLIGSIVALIGAAAVVIGLFLPWLSAGRVDRNSFEVVGVLSRFRLVPPPWDQVLGAWQFLGPAVMLPLVMLALRWWRTGAITACVLGLLLTAFATTTMLIFAGERRMGLSLAAVGPSFVIVGGALLIAAGVIVLLSTRKRSGAAMEPGTIDGNVSPGLFVRESSGAPGTPSPTQPHTNHPQ